MRGDMTRGKHVDPPGKAFAPESPARGAGAVAGPDAIQRETPAQAQRQYAAVPAGYRPLRRSVRPSSCVVGYPTSSFRRPRRSSDPGWRSVLRSKFSRTSRCCLRVRRQPRRAERAPLDPPPASMQRGPPTAPTATSPREEDRSVKPSRMNRATDGTPGRSTGRSTVAGRGDLGLAGAVSVTPPGR